MVELVEATSALLDGGATSFDGEHFCLVDAVLDEPRPVRDPIPILVGGNGDRVLRFAGRKADVAGVTGMGRTLADGHRHEVDWSSEAVRHSIDTVRSGAGDQRDGPEVEVLVQAVVVTDDARACAEELTELVPGAAVEDLLEAPFAWIGTVDEIASKVQNVEEALGVSRYVIRHAAMADARLVMDAVART